MNVTMTMTEGILSVMTAVNIAYMKKMSIKEHFFLVGITD
jgi:hypothetical protein